MNREYGLAGETIGRFHASEAFVRGIVGPIGSGKSTACVIEILRRASLQAPSPDGIRRTRWAIIRNSYPELRTTTVKTWAEWIPTEFGRMTFDSPITHRIKVGDLDIEVLFLALDKPDDQKKLLSLELTGAWINEAREVPKAILDALTGRVGRYPSKIMGGATWSGIIMDTNPPDDQNWWYALSEQDTPKGFEFFKQPPGDSEKAENLNNLPKDYYERIKQGKTEEWTNVYVKGMYGYLTEGKPVFPMFRDTVHIAKDELKPIPNSPILLACDWGLTPCAIFGQKLVDGRWLILDELITDNTGVKRFAELLNKYINQHYSEFPLGVGFGDPKGHDRSTLDEDQTAFKIMNAETQVKWKEAPTNEIATRIEIVMNTLNRMVDGHPGIIISPKCRVLRKGFNGGYCYQLSKSGNGQVTSDTPKKNEWSHIHDALQYLLLGGGEYDVVMGKKITGKPRTPMMSTGLDYDIYNYENKR